METNHPADHLGKATALTAEHSYSRFYWHLSPGGEALVLVDIANFPFGFSRTDVMVVDAVVRTELF